jgi:hypothetical protein
MKEHVTEIRFQVSAGGATFHSIPSCWMAKCKRKRDVVWYGTLEESFRTYIHACTYIHTSRTGNMKASKQASNAGQKIK